MRFVIDYLRQAEADYLARGSKRKTRRSAWDILFGLRQSPLSQTCLLLGIDPVAAKLALIRSRLRGETGDPVFGYLAQPDCIDKVQSGLPLDVPTLEKLSNDREPSGRSRKSRTGAGRD